MQPELAAGVCVKLTMKFIFELASVAFTRRCAWGHGLHTSSGVAFAGMQCFDDDDQEPFCHEDEWEADGDVDQMRELAEAEAAALGLLEDGPNEVSLPLITSSSNPSGSDVLVTPLRRHGPARDDEDTVPSGNRITIPQHQNCALESRAPASAGELFAACQRHLA